MTLHATAAQEAADAIKQRRQVVRDLRHIAELVEEGLPAPIGITPARSGHRTSIQVWDTDLGDWLLYFEEPVPIWNADKFGGERVEVPLGPFVLTAWRRAVTEVCS